jgi:hypothetical protein
LGAVALIAIGVALTRPKPIPPMPCSAGAAGCPEPTPTPIPPQPIPPTPVPVPPDPVPPQPVPTPEPTPIPPEPQPNPVPPQPKPVPPKPVPPKPNPVPPTPQPVPNPVPPDPVPPNPTPNPVPPNPTPNPVPPGPHVGGDYDSIMKQALELDKRKAYPQEMQLLAQAIQMNPNRWEAYDLAAQVYMYDYNQFAQGVQSFELSMAHGGNATFHVMHDHGSGNFVTHCEGWLYVSRKGVEYKSWNSTDGFRASRAEIQEAKANRTFGRVSVQNAGLERHAFHIKLNSGRNFNLKGIGQFAEGQRDMILKIIAGS